MPFDFGFHEATNNMNIFRYHTPAVSTLTPLARLNAFQNEVDRLFEGAPLFGVHGTTNVHGFSPALDVYQDKDHVLVQAELPGMKKEDIALSLQDGLLTLSGERKHEKAHDEKSRIRNERFFGKFERTVTLPVQVDGTSVSAEYADGILTVTLPKAEAAKPRQIEIAAN